jgi:hypothetical protein
MDCSATRWSAQGQTLTFLPLNERRLLGTKADHVPQSGECQFETLFAPEGIGLRTVPSGTFIYCSPEEQIIGEATPLSRLKDHGTTSQRPRLPANRSARRSRLNASTMKSMKARVLAGSRVRLA